MSALDLGRRFHSTFEASSGHPPDHDPDDAHDEAVGAAILTAFTGRLDAARAQYNQWASRAGYAPAEWATLGAERLLVGCGGYVFAIDPSGTCAVLEGPCQR